MNQRDAQKLATRRKLSAAAIRLFSERGYDETRTGDIAADVGVSERTFFLHFPTKDRSVFPDHDERVAAMREVLAATPDSTDPFAVVIDQVRIGILATTTSPVRSTRYALIASVPALRDRDVLNDLDYERAFAEFLTERWPRLDLSTSPVPVVFEPQVFASSALAIARAALTTWAGDPGFDPAASAVAALDDLRTIVTKGHARS